MDENEKRVLELERELQVVQSKIESLLKDLDDKEKRVLELERELQVKQLQMESLLEVTKAINNNMSYTSLYSIYKFILMAQLGVERFLFYIKRNDQWEIATMIDIDDENELEISIEEELSFYNKTTHLEPGNTGCAKHFNTVVPVLHKDIPLAYTLLGNVALPGNERMEEKLKFIQTITNIIAVAIENKRLVRQHIETESFKRELKLAADMQALLIPDELPDNDSLSINGVYKPHQTIGGDYYDYIPVSNEEAFICIADISGKGVPAAILMANFQAVLHTLVTERHSMIPLIYKLNKRVVEITKSDKFITLFLAKYNSKTRNLIYVNAGHNPSILIKGGEVQLLQKGCTILGMFEELPEISYGETNIKPGSFLLNYTDGITDTSNLKGELFETDYLINFMKENESLSPLEFNQKLIEVLDDFKGDKQYDDDISILTCKMH